MIVESRVPRFGGAVTREGVVDRTTGSSGVLIRLSTLELLGGREGQRRTSGRANRELLPSRLVDAKVVKLRASNRCTHVHAGVLSHDLERRRGEAREYRRRRGRCCHDRR